MASDGSWLNTVHLATGDFSSFTLDQTNRLVSSSNFDTGSITDLAVLDGWCEKAGLLAQSPVRGCNVRGYEPTADTETDHGTA